MSETYSIVDFNNYNVFNLGEISFGEAKKRYCLYVLGTLQADLFGVYDKGLEYIINEDYNKLYNSFADEDIKLVKNKDIKLKDISVYKARAQKQLDINQKKQAKYDEERKQIFARQNIINILKKATDSDIADEVRNRGMSLVKCIK